MKGIARVCVQGLMSVLLLGVACFWFDRTTEGASAIIVPGEYSTIQEATINVADRDTVFVRVCGMCVNVGALGRRSD